MSPMQSILLLLFLLTNISEALEVFIKVDGEYVAVPGDYRLIKKLPLGHREQHHSRSKRSIANEVRPVVIDGVSQQANLSTIFEMYVSLDSDKDRRDAFSPSDEISFGDCTIYETISWPGNCYHVSPTSPYTLCESKSRGFAEIKLDGCVSPDSTSTLDAFFG